MKRGCSPVMPLLAALVFSFSVSSAVHAQELRTQPARAASRDLFLTTGKSTIIESAVDIERVSVGDPGVAEAVAVSPREVVVNGKKPGDTTLIVWQHGGNRLIFDLAVQAGTSRVDTVRRQLQDELAGQDVRMTVEGKDVFLRGTVKDLVSAQRAAAIAATLGKVVNLLNVVVPPPDAQVLLKVRFANVDRAAVSELGVNILSTGATGTIGRTTTGQFPPPNLEVKPDEVKFTLSDALNIFLFRRDLNLGATIRALQNKRLLEILAEPNVLASNGKHASFLAGGEFPYPTLQGGGAGLGAVTIQFREFGVRLNFLPVVTPRGTIRLQVTPEVSALDYANGLTFQGFTIPGLSTRRVQTEIELDTGQSFAIAGLLDNRITESLSKIPGLGDVPLLGKLFQSRGVNKSNTELLVLVTPEMVRPIPADKPRPEIELPRKDFITQTTAAPRTPGLAATGPVPVTPPREAIPVEQLIESQKAPAQGAPAGEPAPMQFIPFPVAPVQPPPAAAQSTDPQPPAAAPEPAPARGNGN